MAGIDKIYGSVEQYKEFRSWCESNNPSLLKYFYPLVDPWDGPYGQCITNFPTEEDLWLEQNCNIDWVLAAIKEQYGGEVR